jgi:glycosyltransferase involved in cell wall biosynthesis
MLRNPISILIPTRERADLLSSAIESCVAQQFDNCRFIVSDNASADHTRDVVHSFRDPRLHYVNPGRRLSMADNFEYALSHALPGHVLSIGDDDALMPDALQYLDTLIDETGASAIGGRWNCYFWDNFPLEPMRNKLYLWLGEGFSMKCSFKEARRALNFNYSYIHKLAGLYYGLISTKVVDSLRHKGKFFNSITPDAYSAFACSLASKRFVFSHKPFVLAGLSGKSNGVSQLLNVDSSESTKFLTENTQTFHPSLVYCPAEPVIMAEAFLQLESIHPQLTHGLSLSVKRMCIEALRQAKPNVRDTIEVAVRETARKFSMNFDGIRQAARFPSLGARLSREIDEFFFPHFAVRCPDPDVKEIAGAARYAVKITEAKRHKPHRTWAEHQLFRLSSRLRTNSLKTA